MILKVKNKNKALHFLQVVYFLKYILRVRHGFFLNEAPMLVAMGDAKFLLEMGGWFYNGEICNYYSLFT